MAGWMKEPSSMLYADADADTECRDRCAPPINRRMSLHEAR